MYPTKQSNQIGVLIRDSSNKLFSEIKEQLKKGNKVFMRNINPDSEENLKAMRDNEAEKKRLREEVKPIIKIGDKFDTEAFGRVEVTEIFKSTTTEELIYRVKSLECDSSYLAAPNELDDYERSKNPL